jgi:nucleoside-diphosphate-sugar epimerase
LNVVVTGSTGFTGTHLLHTLVAQGEKVTALVRYRVNGNGLERHGVRVVQGDITDRHVHDRLCEGADRIFHLAAAYREAGIPAKSYFKVNTDGSKMLMEAAARAGANRFVHCSTVGVLGDVGFVPADETSAYNPGDAYQRSKCEGEQIALRFAREGRLNLVVIRPTAIYGPGDYRLLKLFRMVARGRFLLLGKGSNFYHMVYVKDLVNALIKASNTETANGRVYIIGGDEVLTLKELARTIASVLNVPLKILHLPLKPFQIAGSICEALCTPLRISPPIYRRRVDFYAKSRIFDITRARRELGYSPEYPLRRGLSLTASWYRKEKLL